MRNDYVQILVMLGCMALGVVLGYYTPRDLELESTAPIEISYEITPEAARLLVVRAVSGFPRCEP